MTDNTMPMNEKLATPQNGEPTRDEKQFVPPVDIYETDNAVTVLAEMPGVTKDSVVIKLEGGNLTIQGAMGKISCENEQPLFQEYETGTYLRTFSVSESIDQSNIEARLENGILRLTLPKMERVEPRQIKVTVT